MNKRAITLVVSVLVILSLVMVTNRLSARSPFSSITGAATLPDSDSTDVDRTGSSYANGQSDSYTYPLPDGQICDVTWSITAAPGVNKFELLSSDAADSPVSVSNSGSSSIHANDLNKVSTTATVTCTWFEGCDTGYALTATRSCEAPPACVENWHCTAWYPCQINTQFRACTDSNACGTIVDKPTESQTCTPPPDEPDGGDGVDDGTDDDDDTDSGTGASAAGDDSGTANITNTSTINETIGDTSNSTGTTNGTKENGDKTTFWLIIGGSAAGGVLMLTLIISLLARRKRRIIMQAI